MFVNIYIQIYRYKYIHLYNNLSIKFHGTIIRKMIIHSFVIDQSALMTTRLNTYKAIFTVQNLPKQIALHVFFLKYHFPLL